MRPDAEIHREDLLGSLEGLVQGCVFKANIKIQISRSFISLNLKLCSLLMNISKWVATVSSEEAFTSASHISKISIAVTSCFHLSVLLNIYTGSQQS